jgi:amino acid transporter
VALAALLYLLLSLVVAELAGRLVVKGGPCGFADACFGRDLGLLVGLCEVVKVVLVVAVIAFGIGSYISEITGMRDELEPILWGLAIFGVLAICIVGGEASGRILSVFTAGSVGMLLLFLGGTVATGSLDPDKYLGDTATIPSASEVCLVLPFAMWFFLGLEELPLLWEIAENPSVAIPRALYLSFFTLLLLSFLTFSLSCMVAPGAAELASEPYPLLTGYRTVFGDTDQTTWWCLLLTAGLVSSIHSFIFATGELLCHCGEVGFLPASLAGRSQKHGTPIVGLVAGSVGSYAICLLLHFVLGNADRLGAVLIAATLLVTLVSYVAEFACFLHLRYPPPPPPLLRVPVSPPSALFPSALFPSFPPSPVILQYDMCCITGAFTGLTPWLRQLTLKVPSVFRVLL